MKLAYQLWDVFTDRPLQGNALAVLPEADGLSEAQMQAIAREFNLSETSFVLPSARGDARARFFTPQQELPFAGHPSLGTACALRQLGRVSSDELQLELEVGLVPLRFERGAGGVERVWMDQGEPQLVAEVGARAEVARALGLSVEDLVATLPLQVVSAGVPFLLVPLDSLEVLSRVSLEPALLPEALPQDHRAVLAFTLDAPTSDLRARMFGAALGVREDPATGAAHGPLGWYLATHELFEFEGEQFTVTSHQGVEMQRPSELWVRVSRHGGRYHVEVGGSAVWVGEGKIYL